MSEKLLILASGNYWVCSNMDTLASIIEQGEEYLLSSGERVRVQYHNSSEENQEKAKYIKSLEWATLEEKKQYAREHYRYIFRGDKVQIVRGRKMLNETKVVNGYYRYNVEGTYGKVYTDYIYFTDGTKTNINNLDGVGVEYQSEYTEHGKTYYFRHYAKENEIDYLFNVGGRK